MNTKANRWRFIEYKQNGEAAISYLSLKDSQPDLPIRYDIMNRDSAYVYLDKINPEVLAKAGIVKIKIVEDTPKGLTLYEYP